MATFPKLYGPEPEDYAGDVEPTESWRILNTDQKTALIDVRTQAEWGYVGIPDLSTIGKRLILQEWQSFPSMEKQTGFNTEVMKHLEAEGLESSSPLFFLCRSGVRSQGAAKALTEAGFKFCFNVKDGFEGPKDAAGHRGTVAGWKFSGLPWQQQ